MIFRVLFLWLFIKLSLLACADGWDYNHKDFVFLENRDLPFSNISEEINQANVYNTVVWAYEEKNKQENLKEWKKELKDAYTLSQIEDFLYKRVNLEKLKDKDVRDYIDIVARQENHVTYDYFMSDEEKKALGNYKLILNEIFQKIDTVNSPSLKLRYFYLALRLAHYKKDNPLQVYEKYKYLLENSDNKIIKDWIQGLYAGALVKNGKVVNGVYEFTKLFDKNSVNFHLSYYNFFHIKTDAQWNEIGKLYSKIDLNTFNDLEGPTMERAYDGKPHADMSIIVKDKTYTTKGFDHTIPPAQIKEFVDYINKLADDAVVKNPVLGSYSVEELLSKDVSKKEYFISFDADKVSGFMGCNLYSGTYEIKEETISFGPLMATKKYCENEMENENLWLKSVSEITSFSIDGKSVLLFDNKGKLILKATKK